MLVDGLGRTPLKFNISLQKAIQECEHILYIVLMAELFHQASQYNLEILYGFFLGEEVFLVVIDEQDEDIDHGRKHNSEVKLDNL